VCVYLIVLPNFNHRMHACTWFEADKPFIKRRCYVTIEQGIFPIVLVF